MEYVTIENSHITSFQDFEILLNKYNIIENSINHETSFTLKIAFNFYNNNNYNTYKHLISNEFHINYYHHKDIMQYIDTLKLYIIKIFNMKDILSEIVIYNNYYLKPEKLTYIKLIKSMKILNKLEQAKTVNINEKDEMKLDILLNLSNTLYPRGAIFGEVKFDRSYWNFNETTKHNQMGYFVKFPFINNLALSSLPLILKQYILNNIINIDNKIKTLNIKNNLRMISKL